MKDSKIMNLDDGAANDIIKSTLNVRKQENVNPLTLKFRKALKN